MQNVRTLLRPNTIDEAIEGVRDRPFSSYLAGGTFLALKQDPALQTLVDLSLLGLATAQPVPTGIRVGAMVALETLRRDPLLIQLGAGVLADALGRTRSTAWRNQATLGGRIRETEPTDLVTTALLLLDAVCVVHAAPCIPPTAVPLAQVAGLPAEALIVAVDISATLGWRCALEAFQETSLAPPLVAVGVALRLDRHGAVQAARVATCGMTPHPARAAHLELALVGATTPSVIDASPHALDADILPVDDWRASAAYRTHLGSTLLGRALRRAVEVETPP